jgi:predicted nicotinamide N-methyase
MYNYLLLIVFIVTAVVSIQSKIEIAFDIDDVDNNDDEHAVKTTTTTTTSSVLLHVPVFNPIGMTQYQLVFPSNTNNLGTTAAAASAAAAASSEEEEDHDAISLNLLKSDSSFCSISSGNDDTASALWGSSVVLSKYIIMMNYNYYHDLDQEQNQSTNNNNNSKNMDMDIDMDIDMDNIQFQGKTVMELGCGGSAVPSLLSSCYLGARRVVATDFHSITLDHVQYHVTMNPCTSTNNNNNYYYVRPPPPPIIETYKIDWEDIDNQNILIDTYDLNQSDIILAADVIYGTTLVQPLVDTISRMLSRSRDSRLIIAMKNGRTGISEFRTLMTNENFNEIHSIDLFDNSFLPPIPITLENDIIARDRYYGNFTIYIYQWKESKTKFD